MYRQTPISRWCAWIVEGCWLLALTLIPIYFNLFSARHFEPDKATTLRSLALVAAAAGLVRVFEAVAARGERATPGAEPAGDPAGTPPGLPWWRRLAAIPLAVPAMVYAGVFLFTTVTSVVPGTSFWGSYQRLQGTYTNLSYMLLFLMIVVTLRSREQLERIITISMATGFTVGAYGVIQHLQLDPLPWRGDVITRVASTMGNSIFVAAYMIMIVPFALYRLIGGLGSARQAAVAPSAGREWAWALSKLLLFLSGPLLLLAVIKFGAAVRTIDFRYWWVFPGAVMAVTGIWWLLTIGLDRRGLRPPVWPAAALVGFLILFALHFALSAGSGEQVISSAADAPRAVDWWLWLLLGMASATVGYGMALALPQQPATPSRLSHQIGAGAAGVTAALLATAIFFTQSRGPWLGLGAGLLVFFTLALWQAGRQAKAHGLAARARLLQGLMIGWLALGLAVGGFLVAFNLSSAPFFEQLRQVPYVGRMGRLLEVDRGTGLVRRLIWAGDTHAGGAVELITESPLRAVIGWGPESMFVAFNPFYPPSLANIEARGASPDRSHMALLDELVTRGILGLTSYFFLLGSFGYLCWRLIRRSSEWHWQLFFIAMLSAVVSHFVEGLVGIPIVSTLMMLWVTLGLTVAGGALAGQYSLSMAPPRPQPAPTPEPAGVSRAEAAKKPAPAPTGRRRSQPARGGTRVAIPAQRGGLTPAALGAYGLLFAVTLGVVWWWNLQPVYADMRFQQGQGLSERSRNLDDVIAAIDDYLVTIRSNPREDFYYLNLGRSLMTLADALRQQGMPEGAANPDIELRALLNLDGPEALVGFVQRTPPMELMSYAEAVLLKAHDLNPLNKDHFANLGRLNSYWYNWTGDPRHLETALDWYAQVNALAPQDVTLLNERVGVLMQLGDYFQATGDATKAADSYRQADELLQRSLSLDPRFADTYIRYGDLIRVRDGNLDAATDQYVKAIEVGVSLVTSAIERIAGSLGERPDLIGRLHAAYTAQADLSEQTLANYEARPDLGVDLAALRSSAALLHTIEGLLAVRSGDIEGSLAPYQRATELLPDNPNYSRNYTIVLSDTRRYDAALAEVNRLITVLRAQSRASEAAQAEQLIPIIEGARR